MSWRVFGEPFLTADFTGTPRLFMPIEFGANTILRAIRTRVVVYNDPAFTSLQGKIWADRSNAPTKLLHTSTNTLTKAQIITDLNGVKEIYFEFNYPRFRAGERVNFALHANGYTGTASTHIAWLIENDPVYKAGLPTTMQKMSVMPYFIAIVGAEE